MQPQMLFQRRTGRETFAAIRALDTLSAHVLPVHVPLQVLRPGEAGPAQGAAKFLQVLLLLLLRYLL